MVWGLPLVRQGRIGTVDILHQHHEGSRKAEDKELEQAKELERAKLSAAGSLYRKLHTQQQLREKLLRKKYSEAATEKALDRMLELVSPLLKSLSFVLSMHFQQIHYHCICQ